MVGRLHRPGMTAQAYTEVFGNHPRASRSINQPHSACRWSAKTSCWAPSAALMNEGLIEVESEYVIDGDRVIHREPLKQPGVSDDDLKRYWFVMTRPGRAAPEAGSRELTAYCEAHPMELKHQRNC